MQDNIVDGNDLDDTHRSDVSYEPVENTGNENTPTLGAKTNIGKHNKQVSHRYHR